MRELIENFIEGSPKLLTALRQASEKSDAAGVRLAAHRLKSNAADFGAIHFSNLCRELAQLGKTGSLQYKKVMVAFEAL